MVNVASRLEALGKELETEITVSDATRQAVGPRAVFRPLGSTAVKGRAAEVEIYELIGLAGEVDEPRQRGPLRVVAGN